MSQTMEHFLVYSKHNVYRQNAILLKAILIETRTEYQVANNYSKLHTYAGSIA